MSRFVLSRAGDVFVPLTRDATGLVLTRSTTKQIWAPKVFDYFRSGLYWVKEARGVKNWVVVVLADTAVVSPAMSTDLDIIELPTARTTLISTLFNPGQRTAIRARLATTDLGVTLEDTDTVETFVQKLGAALGHSAAFQASQL